MKRLNQTLKVMSLLFLTFSVTSCDDDEGMVTPQEQTIAQLASSQEQNFQH